jgi:hypothetical protein
MLMICDGCLMEYIEPSAGLKVKQIAVIILLCFQSELPFNTTSNCQLMNPLVRYQPTPVLFITFQNPIVMEIRNLYVFLYFDHTAFVKLWISELWWGFIENCAAISYEV